MKTIQRKWLSAIAVLLVALLTGCTSYKYVPYIQNSDDVDLARATGLYDAHIMPKDVINIVVTVPDDDKAARIFNLVVQADRYGNNTSGTYNVSNQQHTLMPYVVSNDGKINFPMLGEIQVVGMTKTQLEDYIADQLTGTHLKKRPIVVVQMANYHVSVLGEVTRPGVYTTTNGKINIFEALALAGDMTIYGKRDCVKIVRESATGQKSVVELDLNDANIIASPYYQLQQNDVVYVTPNKTKAKNSGIGTETSLWFTSVSIVISMASLLYNILK